MERAYFNATLTITAAAGRYKKYGLPTPGSTLRIEQASVCEWQTPYIGNNTTLMLIDVSQ